MSKARANALKIIYEDNDLLVLDKPAGLVVDRSETQKTDTLEDWLEERVGPPATHTLALRAGIVHRLDKDTSGLIIVAKTPQALENLQKQFAERVIKKEYLALIHGEILERGIVEGAIGRNPGNREKFTVLENPTSLKLRGAKEAVTEYEPVENSQFQIFNFQSIFNDLNTIQTRKLLKLYSDGFTLLRCFPKTGRTHQIRVHLKYIGHPIVADEKYVGRRMYRLDKRWCKRQFLHAGKIAFKHPDSSEWVEFESPLPEDLEGALKLING